jgi:hypothetical protein
MPNLALRPIPRTFIAMDPETRQRSLIAEAHPELVGEPSAEDLRAFERRLFDRNIRVGLFMAPSSTYVVRDLLTSMDFPDNTYDQTRIDTPVLLRAAGLSGRASAESFNQEVERWLEALSSSWSSSLPHEAVPVMVPEVVGNLVQTHIESLDDILVTGDVRG